MNLKKKIYFIYNFYIKFKIYSSILVFSYFIFDNLFFNDFKKYFLSKNINLVFIKNTLFKNLDSHTFFFNDVIFGPLVYFFSFNLFFLIDIYCNKLKKKIFFIKFGFFNNCFYNKYKIYFLYFILIKKYIIYYFIFFFNCFFKYFILILKNIMLNLNENEKKSKFSIKEILDLINNLTLLELNELIKSLELKYDIKNKVSLDNDTQIGSQKDKSSYSLYLTSVGSNKISVIKIIREINNLGLKESKDLVDSAPALIKENLDFATAESLKKKFEDVGSLIEIK